MPKGIFIRTENHKENLSLSLQKFWSSAPIKNRICKIENCNKKYYGRGYCRNHWVRLYWYANPTVRKYQREYQKKYRLEHYGIGDSYHKCKLENCQKTTIKKYRYCYAHRERIKKHLPLDLSINCVKMCFHSQKGKKNFMWRGGVAQYPNHYLMKKNRLIILMQNPKCEYCGKSATEVHHKDGSKTNHSLSNLQAVCRSCNAKIRFRPNNTKTYRKYKMSLCQIADKIHRSYSAIWRWEKQGILESAVLSNPNIFLKES